MNWRILFVKFVKQISRWSAFYQSPWSRRARRWGEAASVSSTVWARIVEIYHPTTMNLTGIVQLIWIFAIRITFKRCHAITDHRWTVCVTKTSSRTVICPKVRFKFSVNAVNPSFLSVFLLLDELSHTSLVYTDVHHWQTSASITGFSIDLIHSLISLFMKINIIRACWMWQFQSFIFYTRTIDWIHVFLPWWTLIFIG